MALDKFVDSQRLNGAMLSTANKIRSKTSSEEKLVWDLDTGFTDAIDDIVTLVEGTDNANASAEDILSGKTAYVKGSKITGNIPTKTSSDMTISGKTVTAPAGYYATAQSKNVALGAVTSGTATITTLTETYNSTSGEFDVTGSANIGAPSVETAGYVSSSEGTKNSKTNGAVVSATISKIVGSTTITGATTKKPSIAKQDVPTGVTQAASGNATTTAPSSGVYVAVKSDANTGTLTATPGVTTAGYGTNTDHGITAKTATVGAQASDMTYIPITTTTVSVSGKTVSYGSGWITEGSKSVALGTVTSGGATIDTATFAYNSANGNFNISGSKAIGAPSVGTAGYISSTEGTRNGNTATLAATAPKIVGSIAFSGTTTKKPAITKQDVPSGVTQAASGDATTTAPASGVYVAVKSAANTGTITATPSVTTNGYGTADNHGFVVNTTIVGASASDTTYVPITTTSASVSGKTVSYGSGWINAGSKSVADGTVVASVSSNTGGSASMAATGFTALTGNNTSSYYVTLSTAAGSVKAKAAGGNAGYVTSSTTDETAATSVAVSGNGTKLYIPTTGVTASVSSNTAGSASMAATGFTAAGSSTSYYVTLSTSAGSVKAKAVGNGTGMISSSTTNETSATSVSVSGNGNKLYIPTTGVTASVSSNTSGSASMSANGFAAASGTTAYYVSLSTSAGSVKAKAVGNGTGIVTTSTTNETAATSVAVSGNGNKIYIPEATLANEATSGTTYTDGSETAPALVSGDYLYINKGYIPDTKISLAKLVPDGSDIKGHAEYIISGHSAYDNDGVLVAGSIPTLVASDISVSGKTVTIPLGKYTGASGGTAVTKSVADGEYSADSSASSNSTVTPSVALDAAASDSYGFTTTAPSSGTSGTNYLTINPEASATAWSVTPRANITKAGYLAKASKNGTAVSQTPSVAAGTNYYVPVVSNSFSGGGISITTNYSKNDLAVTLADGSDKNVANYTVGAKDTTNYPYYVKVSGSTPAVSGKTKATRAAATYTNSAGVIAAHSGTQIWGANAVEPTVSVNAASGATYVGFKKATMTVAGTNTVTPSASLSGSGCTLSTTNNGISVTATGGGTASVTATATTNAAGYAPASTQLGSATLSASSKTTTATKYISGVTITKPSTGTRDFSVTIPDGNSTITYTFSVDSNGAATLTPMWNGGEY